VRPGNCEERVRYQSPDEEKLVAAKARIERSGLFVSVSKEGASIQAQGGQPTATRKPQPRHSR